VGAAPGTVLVVDDCSDARALVTAELRRAGFRVGEARDGAEAWRLFDRTRPDLVVTDLRMPEADGIDLLRRVRAASRVPVILLTAFADVPTAVTAMRSGADEVLTYPDDLESLVPRVRAILTRSAEAGGAALEDLVIGASAAMRTVRERLRGLAPLRVPVLAVGEPGTGRHHVSQVLHALGPGRDLPLAHIDCGRPNPAPPPLAQPVCLSEAGRLSPHGQLAWLERLRELEASSAAPTGRVLATTSEDLRQRVAQRSFDAELAERLGRFQIALPPLRERAEDVRPLALGFATTYARRFGRDEVRWSETALGRLCAAPWPGHVAQLADAVERLVAFASDGWIGEKLVDEVVAELHPSVEGARERKTREQRTELAILLEECGGNLAEVARRLGLTRSAVLYRARRFGLYRGGE
jgi:two-component system response regulator AtoC